MYDWVLHHIDLLGLEFKVWNRKMLRTIKIMFHLFLYYFFIHFYSSYISSFPPGLLNAVNGLNYDRINQQLSWVPPLTLSGVPILYYRISINSDTNNFPVVITNSTTLYLNWTSSGNYTATIRAVNAVGEGQAASLKYTHIGGILIVII